MGAILTLWFRQIKKYLRSKPRMIGMLGQPILFLFALGYGFGPIYEKAGGGSYIQFIAPGVIAMAVLFTAMFNGIEVIWERQFGFLKETLVAPVSRFRILLGKTLGGATVALIQGVFVFLIALLAGFKPVIWGDVWIAAGFLFLVALLFSILGTTIGSMLQDMQAFPLIVNFIIMPLFFLSGALFPVNGISKNLETIIKFNPLSYGVDGIRGALTGSLQFSYALDFFILEIAIIALFALGSYAFSKIQL